MPTRPESSTPKSYSAGLPVVPGLHPATAPLAAVQSFYGFASDLSLGRGRDPDRPEHLRRRMRLADGVPLDLDGDGQVTVAEYRKALHLPNAQQVQATLLLGGPGRADLTNEFGLDMSSPGIHSLRYAEVATMRTGAFNR